MDITSTENIVLPPRYSVQTCLVHHFSQFGNDVFNVMKTTNTNLIAQSGCATIQGASNEFDNFIQTSKLPGGDESRVYAAILFKFADAGDDTSAFQRIGALLLSENSTLSGIPDVVKRDVLKAMIHRRLVASYRDKVSHPEDESIHEKYINDFNNLLSELDATDEPNPVSRQ